MFSQFINLLDKLTGKLIYSRLINRNALTIFSGVILYLLSSNSFASDLFDMLKRMSDADREQNYQGTFILRKSDNLSTLRVTHGVDNNGVWESIEALNGEPKKVLRHNNRVISVYPDRELVTIRHTDKNQSLHPQLPKNIDQLELFYSINRLSDDRIANHQTLVVDLLPKDQYRYGYRYWVDKNSGMLLRCDLVAEDENKEKKVVEQMMFTSLDYLTETPTQSFELKQFEQYRQQALDEPVVDVRQSAQQRWVVNMLPDGFMLTQSTMRFSQPLAVASNDISEAGSSETTLTRTSPPDLLHLVYSDGLASVSVFIEKNKGINKHLQGFASMGAVNAFGRSVDDYFVTVVGEVPVKTVESMALSTAQLP
ncbi:MAG: MucB/RseB C-terminal domain-containing protein [Gammaproteobacteria bacterium]